MTLFKEEAQLDKSNLPWGPQVSRHVGIDTGSDMDISPHINPQMEGFARGDLQGLSTQIWQYRTEHIITYQAKITID